jgi:hypothetical protein
VIRRKAVPLVLALLCALTAAPAAQAENIEFVPDSASVAALNRDGTLNTQAGAHPWSYNVHFDLKTDAGGATVGGAARNIIGELPQGFVANPEAVPTCPRSAFEGGTPQCPASSQLGVLHAILRDVGEINGPVYNLEPPPGIAAQLAFSSVDFNAIQTGSVKDDGSYRLIAGAYNVPLEVISATVTIWGVPADPEHFDERSCVLEGGTVTVGCYSEAARVPFLSLPGICEAPLPLAIRANSILDPDFYAEQIAFPLDVGGQPTAFSGCDSVPFSPKIAAAPSSRLAENSTGLDFELKLPNEGLMVPGARAESMPKKVEVTLPEGVTVNPSAAEGVGVCSEAQYAAEKIGSKPGEGCPEASKIGSVLGHTPLLDDPVEGSVYLATPYENPEGSLLALYLVARIPERGAIIKQVGRVDPHPLTGQLVTTFDDLPPLPYSDFNLHFREGGRGVLVTPPHCGSYTTVAKLYPWSRPSVPTISTASFQIERGIRGGACPPSGIPPFEPDFQAGSINNAAGAFSPFNMRLIREDGEQDMTKFSAVLPPGQLGSLRGVEKCPASAVAIAKAKSGLQELASPSCPANSLIGHSLAGAGVGSVLTYVGGQIYLSGPYRGAPLSVISITPAVAGPFDVGAVVVQLGLTLNPKTAEVEVDGAASDPIPHILEGIVLKLRDLRIYVDRHNFTLNPTNCEPSQVNSELFGAYLDVFNPADDVPAPLATPYQASECANLGYKPRLKLNLKGGTRRGAHPGLLAVYKPRKADANTKGVVVRLPSSAFLDQAHIRTICTRVQFAADACPKGAQYGYVKAWTPLLDEPLAGPVWLRSSNHKLPDLVFDLHGLVDVEVATRIDSFRGGIRANVEDAPDAPVSRLVLRMQGGKKGLIVNSRSLCVRKSRANAEFAGQNGKQFKSNPVMRPECGKRKRRRQKERRG